MDDYEARADDWMWLKLGRANGRRLWTRLPGGLASPEPSVKERDVQSCNDGSRSASQRPVVLGEASRTGVNIHPTKRRESGSQRRGMQERRGDWLALTRALRGGQLIFSLSFSFFKLCSWTFTALESLLRVPK